MTTPALGSLAHLATIYDIENCPRNDGGRLRDKGEIVNRPGESPQRFFECSRPDCKWWTVIELRRLSGGVAVNLREHDASCETQGGGVMAYTPCGCAQRKADFDPTCPRCDADRHICPGCGDSLTHSQQTCAACVVTYGLTPDGPGSQAVAP